MSVVPVHRFYVTDEDDKKFLKHGSKKEKGTFRMPSSFSKMFVKSCSKEDSQVAEIVKKVQTAADACIAEGFFTIEEDYVKGQGYGTTVIRYPDRIGPKTHEFAKMLVQNCETLHQMHKVLKRCLFLGMDDMKEEAIGKAIYQQIAKPSVWPNPKLQGKAVGEEGLC